MLTEEAARTFRKEKEATRIMVSLMAMMVLALLVCLTEAAATAQEESHDNSLFPFVLPWDDSSSSPSDISGWLHKPAGKFGHITAGGDGHLYAGNQRIRFFGVNCCFGACFPGKDDAEKIAARMAKFGINCVRFHHMDWYRFPAGIMARDVPHTRDLDPEALDRLDYFIAQLKKNGIYTNLNLLVSRQFNAADGLPEDIEKLVWKDQHVVGFFYKPMLDLQKEYAGKLLSHRNPYTGMTYAEDPAVAIVEINNENGLINSWLVGMVDRLPEAFGKDLEAQWNEWLKRRYGTTEKLRQVWDAEKEPLGAELLANGDFSRGMENWVLEQHEGASAQATVSQDGPDGAHAVQIDVSKLGTTWWHVQFNQPSLSVEACHSYTLSFQAKADKPCRLMTGIFQAHDPWLDLGSAEIELTPEWRDFRFVFYVSSGDSNTRVNFGNLGLQTGSYWFAKVSLRPGGQAGLQEQERLEDGAIPLFQRARFGERIPEAQRDWMRFLWDTEDNYWQSMYSHLKEELKVKSVVIGTIVACSTPNLMARLDAVDTHVYWQHPTFPGKPWDPGNWVVPNRTMVNERGGTVPHLAVRRVLNRPHMVTEYNHAAPNTYSSEAFLLLAAYAALQDWDGIFAFAYSHRGRDWDTGCISGFFDIDQHPTKMVTIIPTVAMFGRGDVSPGKRMIVTELSREQESDLLRTSAPWFLVTHAEGQAIQAEAALMHRTAIATEGTNIPKGAIRTNQLKPPKDRFVSDTEELTWNLTDKGRGVVAVNCKRSKAVIGYGGGKQFELGGVVIKPGKTMQDGWSAITVTAMEGKDIGSAKSILITATGYAENTKMGWKNPEKSSVGRDWGERPSLVEGIPAVVNLPLPADRVRAWALDERGQRANKMPIRRDADGNAVIHIGPQWRTLWYEIEAR